MYCTICEQELSYPVKKQVRGILVVRLEWLELLHRYLPDTKEICRTSLLIHRMHKAVEERLLTHILDFAAGE